MPTITISLNEQAYNLLKNYKKTNNKRSFSDAIIALLSNDNTNIEKLIEIAVQKEIDNRSNY